MSPVLGEGGSIEPEEDFYVGKPHPEGGGERQEGMFEPDMFEPYKGQVDFYSEKENVLGAINEASGEDIEHNDWVAGTREMLTVLQMMLHFFHDGHKISDDVYAQLEDTVNGMLRSTTESDFSQKNNVDSVAESIAGLARQIRESIT